MNINLNVNYSTLAGRAATDSYTGDLGWVPAIGCKLRFTANVHVVITDQAQDVGVTPPVVALEAAAPMRATSTQAQNLADNVKTALTSLGLTFVGRT